MRRRGCRQEALIRRLGLAPKRAPAPAARQTLGTGGRGRRIQFGYPRATWSSPSARRALHPGRLGAGPRVSSIGGRAEKRALPGPRWILARAAAFWDPKLPCCDPTPARSQPRHRRRSVPQERRATSFLAAAAGSPPARLPIGRHPPPSPGAGLARPRPLPTCSAAVAAPPPAPPGAAPRGATPGSRGSEAGLCTSRVFFQGGKGRGRRERQRRGALNAGARRRSLCPSVRAQASPQLPARPLRGRRALKPAPPPPSQACVRPGRPCPQARGAGVNCPQPAARGGGRLPAAGLRRWRSSRAPVCTPRTSGATRWGHGSGWRPQDQSRPGVEGAAGRGR